MTASGSRTRCFEVGRSSLEEIDPTKEAVGRRLLRYRDRRHHAHERPALQTLVA